jgi:2-dehydro-3-deoxyphosphogluconate aldolase/(4S)-4-hydroxy-2-oxoglutarate aldolase
MSLSTLELAKSAPMIPVIVVEEAAQAVPLAEALVAGGIKVLEVALRTVAALEAIALMAKAVPDAIVGAGTLRRAEDVQRVIDAGATFGVSPGTTPSLTARARDAGLPLLPGVATPSEAMQAADQGFEVLKFFPAGAAGGVAMLKSLSSPLADVSFCPTGGVSLRNASEYLALPNVVTVGGSWVCPPDMVRAGDWSGIEELARETTEALT